MRSIRLLAAMITLALVVVVLAWFSRQTPSVIPQSQTPSGASMAPPALRIGLIPERDIFTQRRRYAVLAAYLADKLRNPVELVTLSSYQSPLDDFAEKQIDGAFLGSLVAVLSMDRVQAQVVAKPEIGGGISTYTGVVFVRESSPIQSFDDLRGRSIAMVPTTTAGHLFPLYLMARRGMLGADDSPKVIWVGTHDDVVFEVMSGRADAGAVKDLRLTAFLQMHKDLAIRTLATSDPVPNNALLLRADVAPIWAEMIKQVLIAMDQDPAGQAALEQFGAVRFLPCEAAEYAAIYDMVEQIGPDWPKLEIDGPPPQRPAGLRPRQ